MFTISATSLSLLNECQRCFYLKVKEGISRPSGPPPALHTKMDILIKQYFDKFRKLGQLPPQLVGKVEGRLFDNIDILNKWRAWQTGLRFKDEKANVQLVGALDDCLFDGKYFIPLDYKTKGTIKDDSHIYHQDQLNIYTWLLDKNGYPTKNVGYLVFFSPLEILNNNLIKFEIVPKKIDTSKEDAVKLFYKAVSLLQGPLPEKHKDCQYCLWVEDIHDII